jgi:hypothetical protein
MILGIYGGFMVLDFDGEIVVGVFCLMIGGYLL